MQTSHKQHFPVVAASTTMSYALFQNDIVSEDIEMEETPDDVNKTEPAATEYTPDYNRYDTNRCLKELHQIMRDAADATESLAKKHDCKPIVIMQACEPEQLCSAFKYGLSLSSNEHKNTT